jgi:hypothetical protein
MSHKSERTFFSGLEEPWGFVRVRSELRCEINFDVATSLYVCRDKWLKSRHLRCTLALLSRLRSLGKLGFFQNRQEIKVTIRLCVILMKDGACDTIVISAACLECLPGEVLKAPAPWDSNISDNLIEVDTKLLHYCIERANNSHF